MIWIRRAKDFILINFNLINFASRAIDVIIVIIVGTIDKN